MRTHGHTWTHVRHAVRYPYLTQTPLLSIPYDPCRWQPAAHQLSAQARGDRCMLGVSSRPAGTAPHHHSRSWTLADGQCAAWHAGPPPLRWLQIVVSSLGVPLQMESWGWGHMARRARPTPLRCDGCPWAKCIGYPESCMQVCSNNVHIIVVMLVAIPL